MMKHLNSSRTWLYVLGTSVLVLALIMTGFANQAETKGTYSWHSELLEVDEARNVLTLEARIVGYAELDDLESFSPGDRISLTWSGSNSRADAIRAVRADRGSWDDPFTMPVEFVSAERENRYLRFSVTVPDEGLAAISSLEPGQWVTVTTRQHPSGPSETVVAVRPYNS